MIQSGMRPLRDTFQVSICLFKPGDGSPHFDRVGSFFYLNFCHFFLQKKNTNPISASTEADCHLMLAADTNASRHLPDFAVVMCPQDSSRFILFSTFEIYKSNNNLEPFRLSIASTQSQAIFSIKSRESLEE